MRSASTIRHLATSQTEVDGHPEQGFMLVGLIVAIFLILLVLSVAAPRVAMQLKRDRELEAVHRGNQYVRAIQLYYRKFNHYPGSIEQLEKSNNIRFLRQKYLDPMTGKNDWRLIPVGQNKTTVKGLFGKPLAGLPGGGLGSAASLSSGIGGSGTTAGTAGDSDSAFSSPGTSAASPATGASASSSDTAPATTGASATTGSIASTSATDFKGGTGPFMGIGSQKPGDSIIELNEQTTYLTWEFIYDPRIEQLRAKSALLGGAPASTGLNGLGGSPASTTAPGSTSPTTSPTTPTAPSSPTPQPQ